MPRGVRGEWRIGRLELLRGEEKNMRRNRSKVRERKDGEEMGMMKLEKITIEPYRLNQGSIKNPSSPSPLVRGLDQIQRDGILGEWKFCKVQVWTTERN